ncbi:hypothetical protein YC2023_051616 [Brassica napus]
MSRALASPKKQLESLSVSSLIQKQTQPHQEIQETIPTDTKASASDSGDAPYLPVLSAGFLSPKSLPSSPAKDGRLISAFHSPLVKMAAMCI